MPKTINVNLPERVRLMDIIGAQEAAGVQAQRQLMQLLDAVELSDDERAYVDLRIDAGAGLITWNPEKAAGVSYDVRLSDNQAALLAAILNNDGGRYRLALRVRGDEWAGRVLDACRGEL